MNVHMVKDNKIIMKDFHKHINIFSENFVDNTLVNVKSRQFKGNT